MGDGERDRPGACLFTRDQNGLRDDRSLTPIVAIVILFGLVIIGATLLFLAGTDALQSVESQSEQEIARTTMQEVDSRLATVAVSDQRVELPLGADGVDGAVTDDGSVTVTWHNGDPTDPDNSTVVSIETLGAIVFETDGSTIVHQGGGVFERRGEETAVHNGPAVSYDGEVLGLEFVVIDGDGDSDSAVAVADAERSREITRELDEASAEAIEHGYSHVTIEVESEFADGWHSHLVESMGAETDDNVTVQAEPDEGVEVVIENFTRENPHLVVSELDGEAIVSHGEGTDITVTVTNDGRAAAVDESVEVSVSDGNQTIQFTETVTLEPGESETLTVSIDHDEIPGHQQHWHNLTQYGERSVTATTMESEATGGFAFAANNTVYRLDDVTHEHLGNESNVVLSITNVGDGNDTRNVHMDLSSDVEAVDDLLGEVEWDAENLSLDPGESGNASFAINRSMLPDANYTYSVEIENVPHAPCTAHGDPWCERTGEFEIADGAVGDVGEIVITEPAEVDVSIIGTEISAEGHDPWGVWEGWYKRWAPVTASVAIGDSRYRFMPDGSVTEIPFDDPHYTPNGTSMEDFNLNTFGTQNQTYDLSKNVTEGTITIESTYWSCDAGGFFDTGDWEHVGTDTWNDREYDHWECGEFGEPITIDVTDDDVDPDGGFVMTRDQDRSELPDIEEGYPRQRSVQEVFEDGTDDIDLVDGNLTLSENDFAFMMEVTMDRDGLEEEYAEVYSDGEYAHAFDGNHENATLWNLAAWDIAQHYRHENPNTGDPNFNDVIGFVQVDGGGTHVDFDPEGLVEYTDPDGESHLPETEYSFEEYESEGGAVEAGSDYIVIS